MFIAAFIILNVTHAFNAILTVEHSTIKQIYMVLLFSIEFVT